MHSDMDHGMVHVSVHVYYVSFASSALFTLSFSWSRAPSSAHQGEMRLVLASSSGLVWSGVTSLASR